MFVGRSLEILLLLNGAKLTAPRQLGCDDRPEVSDEIGQRPLYQWCHVDQRRPVRPPGLAGRREPGDGMAVRRHPL